MGNGLLSSLSAPFTVDCKIPSFLRTLPRSIRNACLLREKLPEGINAVKCSTFAPLSFSFVAGQFSIWKCSQGRFRSLFLSAGFISRHEFLSVTQRLLAIICNLVLMIFSLQPPPIMTVVELAKTRKVSGDVAFSCVGHNVGPGRFQSKGLQSSF